MESEKMNPFYATILESSSSFLQAPADHVQREEVNKNLNSNSDTNWGRGKKKVTTWFKGPWTSREDRKLISLVERFGVRKWASVAMSMPGRIGKQCRERWHNNLCPTIEKKMVWSDEEERMIIKGHMRFGNSWSAIAKSIPGRSENAVKNHWNCLKRKQLSTKKIKSAAKLRGLYQSNLLENYIKKLFFDDSAAATPPVPPTTAAAATPPPPVANTTLIAPPPPIIAPPPPPAVFTNETLIPSGDINPPLSVDDYEIDGVPYFKFEIAEIMQSLYTEENADGASTSYFAAETIDEEMSFMRSMFGNNNIGGV